MESIGKVAAVVMLLLSVSQNDWALEMNLRKLAMVQRASELEDIKRISKLNLHTPSSGVRRPQLILACRMSEIR